MDEKLADEVIKVTLEEQRIWERKEELLKESDVSGFYSDTDYRLLWDKLSWKALQFKMQKIGAIS